MDLLRSFVTIVETGSMVRASEHVFLTQSALSLQMKRLADILQQPIFRRQQGGVVLTPTGETLLTCAREILALNDQVIGKLRARMTGPARIGMVQDFADAGAGFSYSDCAGQTATNVKFTRVAMLGPELTAMSMVVSDKGSARSSLIGVPWFVVGFVLVMLINSSGVVAPAAAAKVGEVAVLLVTTSIIAAAIRSPLPQIVRQGMRPIAVIAGATIVSSALSLLTVFLLL
ncbi:MAG: putative sulfate exporter family transporter [Novosphingobium sp.]|nr:putative sulfate exporter family transporter [Novosphingobium sp.]